MTDTVSTSSSNEVQFSEGNGQETAFFPSSFPRSNSLTAPNRHIGAIGNEFETSDSRNDQYNTSYCEEDADHTLDTQSLNSIPCELENSFNSHRAKGCGKHLNCLIL